MCESWRDLEKKIESMYSEREKEDRGSKLEEEI